MEKPRPWPIPDSLTAGGRTCPCTCVWWGVALGLWGPTLTKVVGPVSSLGNIWEAEMLPPSFPPLLFLLPQNTPHTCTLITFCTSLQAVWVSKKCSVCKANGKTWDIAKAY